MKDATEIPVARCPVCHYKMDHTAAATKEGRQKPSEGDLSVCFRCGTATKFDKNLIMVPLTAEDMAEIELEDPDVYLKMRKVQGVIAAMRKQN